MSISKRRILDEALKLFSTKGYEATSIGRIADAVGIRKASLYSHFKSKQEILDTLMDETEKRYEEHSLSVRGDWERVELYCGEHAEGIAEEIYRIIKKNSEFLIQDTFFCRVRNFLTIEQFRDPRLACLKNKSEYTDVLNHHKRLVECLVVNGILADEDREIMTYEFFSPIYVQFYQMQGAPGRHEESMKIIERHIKHFFKIYGKDRRGTNEKLEIE